MESVLVLEVAHGNRHSIIVVRPEQDTQLIEGPCDARAVVCVRVENIQLVVGHLGEPGSIGVVLNHKLPVLVDCEC